MKVQGVWSTEYAVAVPREKGYSYHNHASTEDEVLGDVAEWQAMGHPEAHIVTRQVLHTEWQPIDKEQTT